MSETGEIELRLKRFEMFRNYLEHEDSLMDRRIKWNLTIQGLLFGAFGFSVRAADDASQRHSADAKQSASYFALFLVIIPIVAVLMNLFASIGILAAQLSLSHLNWHWERERDRWARAYRKWTEDMTDTSISPWFPTLGGGGRTLAFSSGLLASLGPAIVLTGAWTLILLMRVSEEHPTWDAMAAVALTAGLFIALKRVFQERRMWLPERSVCDRQEPSPTSGLDASPPIAPAGGT